MTPSELKEAQLRAHDILFKRGRPAAKMLRTWRNTRNAYAALVAHRFNKVFQKMQRAGRRKWANWLAAEGATASPDTALDHTEPLQTLLPPRDVGNG
jgi:hypothetical protein